MATDKQEKMDRSGPFEARYLAFLETITNLRPSLHRYCSRMTGSVLDGEDIVQDALFEAYRKLDQYDDRRSRSLVVPDRTQSIDRLSAEAWRPD